MTTDTRAPITDPHPNVVVVPRMRITDAFVRAFDPNPAPTEHVDTDGRTWPLRAPVRAPGWREAREASMIRTNSFSYHVSAEMAALYGFGDHELGPITRETYVRRVQWETEKREAWRLYDRAVAILPAVAAGNPAALAVIDLHKPVPREGWDESPICHGCDYGGMDAEPPEWPCSSVAAVADVFDVPLPSSSDLCGPRPEPTP